MVFFDVICRFCLSGEKGVEISGWDMFLLVIEVIL